LLCLLLGQDAAPPLEHRSIVGCQNEVRENGMAEDTYLFTYLLTYLFIDLVGWLVWLVD